MSKNPKKTSVHLCDNAKMCFQVWQVTPLHPKDTMQWHTQRNVRGLKSNVAVVLSDERWQVRAQHRPLHSRCLLLITGSLGRRRAPTYKQTNKRRHTITCLMQLAHTGFRRLQKIVPRYLADIPSFADDSLEPLLSNIHFPIALRVVVVVVFFFFFSDLNLGGNVKELPPSTSSRWKVRSHFNHCDSLTGSPWFPRLAAF